MPCRKQRYTSSYFPSSKSWKPGSHLGLGNAASPQEPGAVRALVFLFLKALSSESLKSIALQKTGLTAGKRPVGWQCLTLSGNRGVRVHFYFLRSYPPQDSINDNNAEPKHQKKPQHDWVGCGPLPVGMEFPRRQFWITGRNHPKREQRGPRILRLLDPGLRVAVKYTRKKQQWPTGSFLQKRLTLHLAPKS